MLGKKPDRGGLFKFVSLSWYDWFLYTCVCVSGKYISSRACTPLISLLARIYLTSTWSIQLAFGGCYRLPLLYTHLAEKHKVLERRPIMSVGCAADNIAKKFLFFRGIKASIREPRQWGEEIIPKKPHLSQMIFRYSEKGDIAFSHQATLTTKDNLVSCCLI